jgi:hypothetical protein
VCIVVQTECVFVCIVVQTECVFVCIVVQTERVFGYVFSQHNDMADIKLQVHRNQNVCV